MATKSSVKKTSTSKQSRSVPNPKPITGIKQRFSPTKGQLVILAAIRSYEETTNVHVSKSDSFSKWLMQFYEGLSSTRRKNASHGQERSDAEQEHSWAQWWEDPRGFPASALIDLMNNLKLPAMYFKDLAQFRRFVLGIIWRYIAEGMHGKGYLSDQNSALKLRAAHEEALVESGLVSTLYDAYITCIPSARQTSTPTMYARKRRRRGSDDIIISGWTPGKPIPLSVYEDIQQIVNRIDTLVSVSA